MVHQFRNRSMTDRFIRIAQTLPHMNRQMRKSGVCQTLKRHMDAILTANQRKYSRIATHFTDEITIPSMQADRAHILPRTLQS